MKVVFKYLKPFYLKMALGLSIKIMATLVELALPYILNHILKNVVGTLLIEKVIMWGVLMIVCALLACLLNIFANRMAARVSASFSQKMRHDLFERMFRLSAGQTDKFTIPSLEARITTDTYNVHHFVGMMQRMGVRAPIMLVGGIAITFFMDSFLALIMLSIVPFIFVTVFLISKKGVPLYSIVQEKVDGMIRVVREDTQGIRVIKALSKVEYEHGRFDEANGTLSKKEKTVGTVMGAVNPAMNLIMNIGITIVVALSAKRVAGHLSDAETVIAFMQYFTMISTAMMSITRIFNMFTKCAASAKRIGQVLDTPVDIPVYSAQEYPAVKTDAHILFDNVSFSYNGVKNNVEDISLKIKKGGSLGIIGATGSGKTTVVKLLLRFYDCQKGGIYINGVDIRTIEKERLYAMFGTAMQQDFIYADTIKENILLGRTATDEEIIKAAKIAQAHDFINNLPEKYEYRLSQKGTNVSGGQKQRILIARALLKQPEILVLDDSSSALDYKTDLNLRRAVNENLNDPTLVTVAQRVSSVKDCDVIIVLDEGKIIGAGTHEQLLQGCREYKEISDSQMGGAFVE